MKRVFALLITTAFILAFTACQKTPSEPIVIQKDMERLIEVAQATQAPIAEVSLKEQLGAPATWQYTGQNTKGDLTMEINASVVLPDANAMPIVRVEAADFTQDTVKQFFDFLCSDAEFYDDAQILTKKEIEEMILSTKRLRDGPDYEDDPAGQAEFDIEIEALKKQYETAPDTVEPRLADGTMYTMPLIDPHLNVVGGFEGIQARWESAGLQSARQFTVENNNDLKESIVYEYDGGCSALPVERGAKMFYFDSRYDRKNERWHDSPLLPITDESKPPAEALGKLKITPKEARESIERLLSGTDMVVYNISLTSDYSDYEGHDDSREKATYGYLLQCICEVNGIPTAVVHGASSEADKSSDDSNEYFRPSWSYEHFDVLITDDGIIDLNWHSPHTVKETITEQAQLLSFSEVSSMIEKALPLFYPNQLLYDYTIKHTTVRIDRIELALRRVNEPNNIDAGLFIPAWSCYGSIKNEYEDGYISDSTQQSERIVPDLILTINGLDGSIIDTEKGY